MSLLRQARLKAGLSIEQAAKNLSISAGYLSQIENGRRNVGTETAIKISKYYNLKIEDIFLASRYAVREVEETA